MILVAIKGENEGHNLWNKWTPIYQAVSMVKTPKSKIKGDVGLFIILTNRNEKL